STRRGRTRPQSGCMSRSVSRSSTSTDPSFGTSPEVQPNLRPQVGQRASTSRVDAPHHGQGRSRSSADKSTTSRGSTTKGCSRLCRARAKSPVVAVAATRTSSNSNPPAYSWRPDDRSPCSQKGGFPPGDTGFSAEPDEPGQDSHDARHVGQPPVAHLRRVEQTHGGVIGGPALQTSTGNLASVTLEERGRSVVAVELSQGPRRQAQIPFGRGQGRPLPVH